MTDFITHEVSYIDAFSLNDTLNVIEKPWLNNLISEESRHLAKFHISGTTGTFLHGSTRTIAKLKPIMQQIEQHKVRINKENEEADPASAEVVREVEELKKVMAAPETKPEVAQKLNDDIAKLEDSIRPFITKIENEVAKYLKETKVQIQVYGLNPKTDLCFQFDRDYYPSMNLVTELMGIVTE